MTFLNVLKISAMSLVVFACTTEQNQPDVKDTLNSYFKNITQKDELTNKKAFVYFSEARNCVKCTEEMIQVVTPYLDNQEVLYLLSGNGSAVDITALREKERANVFFDPSFKFIDETGIKMSCFVLLNEDNDIDTTVYITADRLSEQMFMLTEHINL